MTKYSDHGFSFLEVLISLLIISTALLGLTAAEIKSLRINKHIYVGNLAHVKKISQLEHMKISHRFSEGKDLHPNILLEKDGSH